MDKFKYLNTNKIRFLPPKCGVYCFQNKNGEILYIGKAANLKERVKNHFQQPSFQDNLFINLVSKVGYLQTDSEIEALILEANLIKKRQPKFNVMWRDDKNYFFAGITEENFPKVFITHQANKTNGKKQIANNKQLVVRSRPLVKYVGPFIDGQSLREALKILRKIFPFRNCNTIPKRPCLWYQLSRCPAPCLLKSNLGSQLPNAETKIKKECRQNVRNVSKILLGRKARVINELRKEMKTAAASKNFEKAAKIRDKIYAMEKILSHAEIFELREIIPSEKSWNSIQKILQKILDAKKEIFRIEAYDISNIQGREAVGSMVVFVNGKADKDQYRKFKIKYANSVRSTKSLRNADARMRIGKPNDTAMIKEVLDRRFKHREWPFPDAVLIDGGKAQLNAALKSKSQNPNFKKIKVAALAKKQNKLFIENGKNPLPLKTLPREIFNLILQLRDEAHRSAIGYHKKLRKRRLIEAD